MKSDQPRIKCLSAGCSLDNYARGLCRWHYQIGWKLVARRQTTWAKLVKNGLARASKSETFEREVARMKGKS